ncbi:MAG: hypothetical protein WBA52_13935 [Dolichospermum sp.]
MDRGEYRILYTIDDDNKLVAVFRVSKRMMMKFLTLPGLLSISEQDLNKP